MRLLFAATTALLALASAATAQNASHIQEKATPVQLAQGGLCQACQPFGNTCCALRRSVAACIKCGLSYGYAKEVATRFCQKNQPQCAK